MAWKFTTAAKKLLKFSSQDKRFFCVKGGTGGGKTFNILPILLDKAIKQPGLSISVVAETVPHLKRGAIRDFKKIAISLGRWNSKYWNDTDKIYKLPNGSYIEFFSADDDSKLRGLRRDILYINECNRVSFEAFTQLQIRTAFEVWLDYNPVATFWIDKEILNRDNAALITLTYKDNEALPDSIVDEIEDAKRKAEAGSSYWQNWFNVYGLGLTGSLEGACITEYKTIEALPRNEDGRIDAEFLCIGLDFGYTNDATAAVALWKHNGAYIIDEVIYKTGLLNRDISAELKEYFVKHQIDKDAALIYVDAAEPKSRDELKFYGLPNTYSCSNKQIVQGINLINQQTNLITKRSENVLREVSVYVWAKDKEGNKINKPVDKDNHTADAWRYGLSSYLDNPSRNEYYIY